jgi:hypothetical protein
MANLGDVHAAAGDPTTALHVWDEASIILDSLHFPDAELLRTKLKAWVSTHQHLQRQAREEVADDLP